MPAAAAGTATNSDRDVAESPHSVVYRVMAKRRATFESFFAETEPKLRRALCATYGPSTGRAATVDALSWAWEHWPRVCDMQNPSGYLYNAIDPVVVEVVA